MGSEVKRGDTMFTLGVFLLLLLIAGIDAARGDSDDADEED